jgi:hypothetical protein
LENGIEVDSPKAVFRELASLDWIEDAEVWFQFLLAKNLVSDSYKEEIANSIFLQLNNFINEATKLIEILTSHLETQSAS